MQSDEELKGKLQTFPDVYRHNIGEDLDPKDVENYLKELIAIRKNTFISAAFSGLTVPEARRFLELLKQACDIDKQELVRLVKNKKAKDNRKNLSKQSKE